MGWWNHLKFFLQSGQLFMDVPTSENDFPEFWDLLQLVHRGALQYLQLNVVLEAQPLLAPGLHIF